MVFDLLAALFLILSAAALTYREVMLSKDKRTWPPAGPWLLNLMYAVVCMQLSRAAFIGNRAFESSATHADLAGVALIGAWAALNVGWLANALYYRRHAGVGQMVALANARLENVAKLGKGRMLPDLHPDDMQAASAALDRARVAAPGFIIGPLQSPAEAFRAQRDPDSRP